MPAAWGDSAPTAPTLINADKISAGDTAWMLTSTALVLMMSIPGLALFYGGMVRKKNVLATLMQTFAIVCIVTILWWLVGYSWAFTPGSKFSGRLQPRFVRRHDYSCTTRSIKLSVSHLALTIPETVYAMFQLTFAVITPALICRRVCRSHEILRHAGVHGRLVAAGLCADRAHGVGADRMAERARRSRLRRRHGRAHQRRAWRVSPAASCSASAWATAAKRMPPHNLTLTLIGASLLWVGWFGFNAGSAGAADGRAGMAMLVTQMATAAAALGWMFAEWIAKGKPSVLGIASGAVAGIGGHHAGVGLRRTDARRGDRPRRPA